MSKLIIIVILMCSSICLLAQKTELYFKGGVIYGLSLNTIYRYTDQLRYFDELNYGKKITPTFGFYANRGLTKNVNFEIALVYHKRGTSYRIFYSPTEKARYGSYGQILDLHYISVPIVIQKNLIRRGWLQSMRYGAEVSSLFFVNMPQVEGDGQSLYRNFDYSGILGIKLIPERINFFNNKAIIVDFRFSLLPIVDEDWIHLLETAKDFRVLPNQRNFSVTLCLQHEFNSRRY